MKKTTLFLLLLLPIFLAAQPATNLLTDKKFFEEKKIEYGRWLDSSGLGKILRVESIKVSDKAIALNLGFHTSNYDTVCGLWNNLRTTFDKQDRGMTLEEVLFDKMLYFMEVKPSQAFIQLYESYDTRQVLTPCFYRLISFQNQQVKVKEENCRSVNDTITVASADLSNLRSVSKNDIAKKTTKDAVFERIKRFVEARYRTKPKECENRKPEITWFNDAKGLKFRVTDLCKEILDDETNPWWCSVLEPACSSCRNCRKREFLEMTIQYAPVANGYRIYVSVDAKIGSGWYQEVKRGAYKNMELDYKKYVNDYTKKMSNLILEELKKP